MRQKTTIEKHTSVSFFPAARKISTKNPGHCGLTLSLLLVLSVLNGCSEENRRTEGSAEISPSAIKNTASLQPASPPQQRKDSIAEKKEIAPATTQPLQAKKTGKPESYETIDWTDLIPKSDLDALLNPPKYLENIEEGSSADQLNGNTPFPEDDSYQRALTSTKIKPEYNNRALRIPGFIVPLEFNDQQVITTFFLVPYYGACIHLPPPPPNQTIYAEYEPGIKLEHLYDPFWVQGTLKTFTTQNDIAAAAYAIEVDLVEPYDGK